MNRISIHFVNLGLAVAAIGTLSLACPHVLLARLQPDACVSYTERPNIIFLLTDDHRWDALGYAGNGIIQTPELDKLAAKGIYFKNAYVTTSICCVSRASILSGQYASRHQVHDFATDFDYEVLYDIESDPHEITNLASQPAYGNLLDTMRDRYGELKELAK